MTYTSDFMKTAQDLHCQDCQHWGGWAPIRVGNKIDDNTHGLCNNKKHCRVIGDPTRGCSMWAAADQQPAPAASSIAPGSSHTPD